MSGEPIDVGEALAFSEATEAEFRQLLGHYPDAQAMVLPALHLAQREFGYLSEGAMEYVARRLGVPPAKVLGPATFYEMFRCYPVGRFHIQVCTGPSCALAGGDRILEHLQTRLGIKPGQTTPDRLFTLSGVECLACCGTAPVLLLNGQYVDEVTIERLEALLAQCEGQAQSQGAEP